MINQLNKEKTEPFQVAAFINPKMAAWGREQQRKRAEQQKRDERGKQKEEVVALDNK